MFLPLNSFISYHAVLKWYFIEKKRVRRKSKNVFLCLGGNLLCLSIWSGTAHCSPHIHSIHFFYATGAFVAPLAAAPFLSTKALRMKAGLPALRHLQERAIAEPVWNVRLFSK